MAIFSKKKKGVLSNAKPNLDKKQKKNLVSSSIKVATGLVTGAVAGLLFAPRSGKDTRKQIQKGASNFGNQVSDKSKELGEATKEQFNHLKDTVKEKANR